MSHLPTLGACSALKAFPGSVTSRLGGYYGVTSGSLSSSSASASEEQGPNSVEIKYLCSPINMLGVLFTKFGPISGLVHNNRVPINQAAL